ncbi:hypothetical protein [Paenibacillus sp. DMB5]|uniref:hypothetical protein n=1 Tax=Paenibacillus sp. DMB5 TaxID=1780103 RepID=UPI00076C1647|nr:hypothetical protein [Paenibacillus sp. DMB5]KUP24897.1 hypothetical protein AWJ19_03145 [Paenibacillus sp. DMB5]
MSESTEAPRLWIKSYQATDRDPITRRFCRSTGLSTPAAVGTLHMLWWWVLDWAQDGDISKYQDIDIADAVSFEGEPQVLMRALVDAGYVIETQSGREIANWFRIGGQIIESKKKDAERKAEAREKKRQKKEGLSDVRGKSGGHPTDNPGTSEGVPKEVLSIDKDLDIDKDLELNKDLKINGHADQNSKTEPKQEPDLKSEPTAEKPKAPKESEKPKNPGEKGPKGRKKPEYAADSLYFRMATGFKERLDKLAKAEGVETLVPRANLQSWADDFRKLVELDKQSDIQQIADVMDWVVQDSFWKRNVLSGETFREKYPKLLLAMKESKKAATGNKGSGGAGGGRGYGHQKQEIPITQDNGTDGTPTESEYAAMMRRAAEIKAEKIRIKEAGGR